MTVRVKDVLQAMDDLTNGRCLKTPGDWASGKNPWVVTKSSNIPGKAVVEMPGLVWGDPEMEVKKIAVMMTMTESAIELAAATGVNALVTHHPIADAANSGGVLIKYYLGAYNLACFELHEAFHGMHPGIPWLHGHKPHFASVCYDGIPGNIVYVGDVLPEIKTVGDMIKRLDTLMNVSVDEKMLAMERELRNCPEIEETSVAARAKILVGSPDRPMKKVIHMFPHCGFNCSHLEKLVRDNPEVDTLLATISRVYPGHELIAKAEELGLNFVCGNSHAMEIFENGVPMANALKKHLPECEVVIFRERMTSVPLTEIGSPEIRDYAEEMSVNYLHRK
ncbi:MAG: Nif3-like dinuclear metal center hexameric protein [Peptococcaceae bacterium]|nr:Nif3-like dinuclear metal center hexameric protein [Peptococcaceae bacterium]